MRFGLAQEPDTRSLHTCRTSWHEMQSGIPSACSPWASFGCIPASRRSRCNWRPLLEWGKDASEGVRHAGRTTP